MKVGKICLLFFMSASILLAGCGNAKNKKGEDNLVGKYGIYRFCTRFAASGIVFL